MSDNEGEPWNEDASEKQKKKKKTPVFATRPRGRRPDGERGTPSVFKEYEKYLEEARKRNGVYDNEKAEETIRKTRESFEKEGQEGGREQRERRRGDQFYEGIYGSRRQSQEHERRKGNDKAPSRDSENSRRQARVSPEGEMDDGGSPESSDDRQPMPGRRRQARPTYSFRSSRRSRESAPPPVPAEEGRGSGGSDGGPAIPRYAGTELYEKGAYERHYVTYRKIEREFQDVLEKIAETARGGDITSDLRSIKDIITAWGIELKNIQSEYFQIFFQSLPGGIEGNEIRETMYADFTHYCMQYFASDKIKDKIEKMVTDHRRATLIEKEEARAKAPPPRVIPSPAAPPAEKEEARAKAPPPRVIPSPAAPPADDDSAGKRRGSGRNRFPPSDAIPEEDEEGGREEEEEEAEEDDSSSRGAAAARFVRDAKQKAQEAFARGFRRIRNARRGSPFNIFRPDKSGSEVAAASTPEIPRAPRLHARAARRLEKMGYYKTPEPHSLSLEA
jgi:hypothetical protein